MPARHPAFLVPGYALSKIFRGKFRAGLKKLGLLGSVPNPVWSQNWVVHCQHGGRGQKVLEYLGRYVFRVAIVNSRLERFENGWVTFRYRDNRTHQIEHRTLCAEEFLRRFFSHVLPRGLVKVRSYGLWSANNSDKLDKARGLLASTAPQPSPTAQQTATPPPSLTVAAPMLCPQCKIGHLIWVQCLLPQQTRAP